MLNPSRSPLTLSLTLCQPVFFWYLRKLQFPVQILKLGIAAVLLSSLPAPAAEFVSVNYGLLQRSLPVESLSQYAQDGAVDSEIRDYLRFLKPPQREQFRQALRTHVPLDVVATSQFLYTAQGEILLERLGKVIRSGPNSTGFYAIRAAMILAAADPEGLTLINVFRKFPTRELQIDVGAGLAIFTEMNALINQTQTFVSETVRQSAVLALQNPLPTQPPLANLQVLGAFRSERLSFDLQKTVSQRALPLDVYLPMTNPKAKGLNRLARLKPAPLLVISHGFGSDRNSFRYLAEYLSSYGFAVAVPEHPGSNTQQIQNWLNGLTAEATEPSEFVDRPLDIHAVLDFLTERSQTEPKLKGRLNLQSVGVIGQSFGGYTALALAGAAIDVNHLRMACVKEGSTLNLSLLLQCRALEIKRNPPLNDPRVKAVFVINPICSAVFGEASLQKITIPTLILGGSNDTVAPLLPEQVYPFSWLQTPEKYLLVAENATHFSSIGVAGGEAVPIPTGLLGPNPEEFQRYIKTLTLVFFQRYLQNQPDMQRYFSDAYLQQLSRPPFRLGILQQILPEQLSPPKTKS